MSEYFSQIATRNIPNSLPVLMPTNSIMEKNNPDPFQEDISFVQKNSSLFPPTEFFQNARDFQNREKMNENIDSALPNKSVEISYFTKHIERFNTGEKKETTGQIVSKNAITHLGKPSTNIPSQKGNNAEDVGINQSYLMEPVSKNLSRRSEFPNSESRNPESKPVKSENESLLKPSFKEENSKYDLTSKNSADIKRLHPAQPLNIPINTKNNQSGPKLVIGKITVEVVQPEKPAPTKVVNRVIQAPPVINQVNTNKLSFGLGQL